MIQTGLGSRRGISDASSGIIHLCCLWSPRKHLRISASKGRLQVHEYISWNFIKAVESVDCMITYVYAQSMNERPLYAYILNWLMKDTYHATVPFAIYQSRTTYPTRKNTPLSAFSPILLLMTSIKGARYQHHARWVPSSLSWFPALSHIPYSLRDYSLPADRNLLVDPEAPSLSIPEAPLSSGQYSLFDPVWSVEVMGNRRILVTWAPSS